MDDQKLLRDYVLAGSHSALRILVSRHLGLVYSAARRMVQEPHLVEKVTHGVFAALARTAASVPPSLRPTCSRAGCTTRPGAWQPTKT